MSITLATIGAGILTGISHPITTFGLLTANTVMNGIELKNDSEMKGSLNRIESTQDKIIEGIETLQVSTSHTVTYSQMEKLLSEPVPAATQTVQQPASNQALAPVQTPAATTTPAQDNNPPAWAQQLMQQQIQQAEIIKNLMQQNNATTTAAPSTTVNVNPATSTPATTTPAATAPAPTSTPAPQTADESALDAKLDKLITGFAAFVDSFKQANAGGTSTTTSTPAATGATKEELPAATIGG